MLKGALASLVLMIVAGPLASCSVSPALTEHSSCKQFREADSAAQNQVLQDMMAAHHDHGSLSTAHLSVTLYCNVYGDGAPIDGVYGSGTGSQPPTSIPTPTPTAASDVLMDVGQTGELDGWRITLKSVRVDMDYQITNGGLSEDENHHYVITNSLNTRVREPLVVCRVLITNIDAQNNSGSGMSVLGNFLLIGVPYVAGDDHITFMPFIEANRIDLYVPIGSSTEGDIPSGGDHGEYNFVFEPDITGPTLRWHFTV